MGKFFLPILVILVAVTGGCGGAGHSLDPYALKSAADIYKTGQLALQRADYESAIKAYHGLESHYPFGDYTRQGQLDLIYAHYMFEEQSAAIFAAERFIRLHPRFPHLDYVYYMRGVAKLNENTGLLERILPLDPSKRDVSNERQAFAYFTDMIQRYPDSPYAPDARQRLVYLRNTLAMHEVHAANYYLRRGAYLAAANRALEVVTHYDQTTAMPQALQQLAFAYKQLGLDAFSEDISAVLSLNFSDYTHNVSY